MNLENQTVTGTNQVTVSDSLNAALMELTLKPTATSVAPNTNELFIYVDKQPQSNPSNDRKQYLFDLKDILRIYNNVADEFKQRLEVVNNDIILKSYVERNISYYSEIEKSTILEFAEIEELESFPITLFEGTNYIYTNYSNMDIELIYSKDTLYNRAFLNGSMYYHHKLRNDGEFCLDDIYFKDAFTKTGNDLNLEVNNVSIDSLNSNSNKFSLDKDGNLIVNTITCNSITCNEGNTSGGSGNEIDIESILDAVYPVGSIFLSMNSVEPSVLFGGTWQRIQDKFLLGIGETHYPGETGGEETHELTNYELPEHTHSVNGKTESAGTHTHQVRGGANVSSSGKSGLESYASHYSTWRTISSSNSNGNPALSAGAHTHDISLTTAAAGEGRAHNNMPPYITVYMWKRVE